MNRDKGDAGDESKKQKVLSLSPSSLASLFQRFLSVSTDPNISSLEHRRGQVIVQSITRQTGFIDLGDDIKGPVHVYELSRKRVKTFAVNQHQLYTEHGEIEITKTNVQSFEKDHGPHLVGYD